MARKQKELDGSRPWWIEALAGWPMVVAGQPRVWDGPRLRRLLGVLKARDRTTLDMVAKRLAAYSPEQFGRVTSSYLSGWCKRVPRDPTVPAALAHVLGVPEEVFYAPVKAQEGGSC